MEKVVIGTVSRINKTYCRSICNYLLRSLDIVSLVFWGQQRQLGSSDSVEDPKWGVLDCSKRRKSLKPLWWDQLSCRMFACSNKGKMILSPHSPSLTRSLTVWAPYLYGERIAEVVMIIYKNQEASRLYQVILCKYHFCDTLVKIPSKSVHWVLCYDQKQTLEEWYHNLIILGFYKLLTRHRWRFLLKTFSWVPFY